MAMESLIGNKKGTEAAPGYRDVRTLDYAQIFVALILFVATAERLWFPIQFWGRDVSLLVLLGVGIVTLVFGVIAVMIFGSLGGGLNKFEIFLGLVMTCLALLLILMPSLFVNLQFDIVLWSLLIAAAIFAIRGIIGGKVQRRI